MFKVWELWLSQYTLQLTKKEAAACGDCHADLAPWPKTRWPNSSFDMESDRSIQAKKWPHVGDLLLCEWPQPNPWVSGLLFPLLCNGGGVAEYRRFLPGWHSQTPAPKTNNKAGNRSIIKAWQGSGELHSVEKVGSHLVSLTLAQWGNSAKGVCNKHGILKWHLSHLNFKNHYFSATRRDFQLKSLNWHLVWSTVNISILNSHLGIFLLGLLFGVIFREKKKKM